jgi:hypothetical protein
MLSKDNQRLSPDLFEYLQNHHPIVVITVDSEGEPCADIVSWVLALDEQTIRLVIGSRRLSIANTRDPGTMALQILGANLAYEIKGTALIIKERCESVRFPQTMVERKVFSVRENMYPANFIVDDLPVSWPESTDTHHHEWNLAISEEMRQVTS